VRLLLATVRCLAAAAFVLWSGQMATQDWAVLYLSATLIAAVVALGAVRYSFGPLTVDLALFRQSAGQSWHFSANVVTERVTNDADKFLLASIGSNTMAGVYGAGYRVVEMFIVPIVSVILSMNSRMFRAAASGKEEAWRATRGLLGLVSLYAVLAALVLYCAAPYASLVLGDDFEASSAVMTTLAALPLLYGLRSTLWLALASAGLHGFRTITQACIAALNIGGNLALIPTLGWAGAAYTTLGCELILVAAFALKLHASRA